jgi:hypothetical protein
MPTLVAPFPKASIANLPTGIAQSVQRLVTCWTVQGSNAGDGGIPAPVHTGPGPNQPPVQWVPRLFPRGEGVKRLWSGIDNSTHLAPRLKNEYSYTSSIPLSRHGLLESELPRYLYLQLKFKFLPHRKHSLQHAIARFIAMSVYLGHT